MDYICFKWEGAISTLSSGPLKLVDKNTYLGGSVSSTENNVNICLVKVWTVIDKLSILWNSDQSDEIKLDFFQAVTMSILLCRCTSWMLSKHREKARWELHKNVISYFEQIPTKQQLYNFLSPISKTIQVRQTRHLGHCWRSKEGTHEWHSSMDPYTWTCQCLPTSKNLSISALCGHRM